MAATVGICCSFLYHAHAAIMSYMLIFSMVWLGFKWNSIHPEEDPAPFTGYQIPSNVYVTMMGPYNPDPGSVMFQFAALLAVGMRNGIQPVWKDNLLITGIFNLHSQPGDKNQHFCVHFTRESNIKDIIQNSMLIKEIKCPDCNQDQITNLPITTNSTLQGNFLDYRYFKGYEEMVLHSFQFKGYISNFVDLFYTTNKKPPNSKRVGIHIDNDVIQKFHRDNIINFVDESIKNIRNKNEDNKLQYILTTDHLSWLKSQLDSSSEIVLAASSDSVLQMALLSDCDHVIFCGGTTPWWGAWMVDQKQNGEIIYCSGYQSNVQSYYDHWKAIDIVV